MHYAGSTTVSSTKWKYAFYSYFCGDESRLWDHQTVGNSTMTLLGKRLEGIGFTFYIMK